MNVRLRMYQVLLFKFARHLCKGSIRLNLFKITGKTEWCANHHNIVFWILHNPQCGRSRDKERWVMVHKYMYWQTLLKKITLFKHPTRRHTLQLYLV